MSFDNKYKYFFVAFLFALLTSCKSRQYSTNTHVKVATKKIETSAEANTSSGKTSTHKVVKDAEKYIGTPYKYGGIDRNGFDCSGLMVKIFEENNYQLPRRSSDQALEGKTVHRKDLQSGDLLFFDTSGGHKSVNHVGIVQNILKDGDVTFVHASSSKGVMVSNLNSNYWSNAFLFAKRVL